MTSPVRERASVDYYALLGVDPSASSDDIARAFRARAKRTHPDAAPDPDSPDDFREVAAAYTVLSDHRRRREYDQRRAAPTNAVRVPTAGERAAAPRRKPWSRRRAWTAFVGGTVVFVLGFAMAFVTWHLHDADASRRAHYVPVVARRGDGGSITFVTRTNQLVRAQEPQQRGEGNGAGSTVKVRYDPADPQHVIVDANTLGRDITLGIVALKLIVGGAVFAVLGYRRLKRTTTVR